VPVASPAPVRVGGQALADGVLMRAGRNWAVARSDGSIETGLLPRHLLAGVPMIRVITGLLPSVVRGLGAMRSRGAKRGVPARVRWSLPLFLLVPLAVDLLIGMLLPMTSDVWSLVAGRTVLAISLQLVALRLVLPAAMWRYHGAEHKAVAAYEAGVAVEDVAAVMGFSRVHTRCGTNVVAILLLLATIPMHVPIAASVAIWVVLLAGVVELVSAAAKRPMRPISRAVLAGGRLLQRYVTTSEPTYAEQAVACRALAACLAAHEAFIPAQRKGALVPVA
jgi:uncharacterized protein YqhQ